MAENLVRRDPALSSAFASPHLCQPGRRGRPCGQFLERNSQKLLHGSTLRGSASGQLMPHLLRHITDGNLNTHECIMPASQSTCKHPLRYVAQCIDDIRNFIGNRNFAAFTYSGRSCPEIRKPLQMTSGTSATRTGVSVIGGWAHFSSDPNLRRAHEHRAGDWSADRPALPVNLSYADVEWVNRADGPAPPRRRPPFPRPVCRRPGCP